MTELSYKSPTPRQLDETRFRFKNVTTERSYDINIPIDMTSRSRLDDLIDNYNVESNTYAKQHLFYEIQQERSREERKGMGSSWFIVLIGTICFVVFILPVLLFFGGIFNGIMNGIGNGNGNDSNSDSIYCESWQKKFQSNCYATQKIASTYATAIANCENTSGWLVTIDSKKENDWLWDTFGNDYSIVRRLLPQFLDWVQ